MKSFLKDCNILTFIHPLNTVKLGDKERLDKEQPVVKDLFTDYQPFHIINILLEKELLPILEMLKLSVSECKIVKISK